MKTLSEKIKFQLLTGLVVLGFNSQSHALIDLTQEPMSEGRLVQVIESRPELTMLDQLPGVLPDDFLMNFVLKHGVKRTGERGHLIEKKVSQSADPLAPRAIIFDERNGFTVSFNGGMPGQSAGQRLDILDFDFGSKKFSLKQIDFPISAGHLALTTSDCASCHGPNLRPIFSMYPDWPAFYGSDNDELTGTTAVQTKEFSDYRQFLKMVATKHPRYSPLFSNARVQKYLGRDLYASFPYRPDTSAKTRDVSRAFAFRPELRLGIVYNRLLAQNLTASIVQHERYSEFGKYFLFNLLQCSWNPNHKKSLEKWLSRVQEVTGTKAKTLSGGLLDYHQNLALFDLKINDVDMRYSYNHEGYKNLDASKKVMEVGYIGRYFNSYFDGSATIDELLAAALYADQASTTSSLVGVAKPWGLVAKYSHLPERFKLDKVFFEQMDKLGQWLEMPYPAQLGPIHHRESFTAEFASDYKKLCSALEDVLK